MSGTVTIVFENEPSPAEATALVDQLRQLPQVTDAKPGAKTSPDGAKSGDAVNWLLVAVEIGAPFMLSELLQWLKAWRRRPGAKVVTLKATLPDGTQLVIDPAGDSPEAVAAKVGAYRQAFGG